MSGMCDEDLEKYLSDIKFWFDHSGNGEFFRGLLDHYERMENAVVRSPVSTDDDGFEEVYTAMGEFDMDYFEYLTSSAPMLEEEGDPSDDTMDDRMRDECRYFAYCGYFVSDKPIVHEKLNSRDKKRRGKGSERETIFLTYHMHAAAALNSSTECKKAEKCLKNRMKQAFNKSDGSMCYGLLVIGGRVALYRMHKMNHKFTRVIDGKEMDSESPPDAGMWTPITNLDFTKHLLTLVNREWLRIDKDNLCKTIRSRLDNPSMVPELVPRDYGTWERDDSQSVRCKTAEELFLECLSIERGSHPEARSPTESNSSGK